MVSRKVRDIYGNWVWETDENGPTNRNSERQTEESTEQESRNKRSTEEGHIQLDWKDWIALTLAALQTILLPFVVIIAILLALALVFAH